MKLDHFLQHTWHYLTTDGGWKTLYDMYICAGMLTRIGTSGLTLLVRSIGAVVFAVAELSRTDAECRAGTLEVWAAAGRRRRRQQGGARSKVTSRDCVCVQTGERREETRACVETSMSWKTWPAGQHSVDQMLTAVVAVILVRAVATVGPAVAHQSAGDAALAILAAEITFWNEWMNELVNEIHRKERKNKWMWREKIENK